MRIHVRIVLYDETKIFSREILQPRVPGQSLPVSLVTHTLSLYLCTPHVPRLKVMLAGCGRVDASGGLRNCRVGQRMCEGVGRCVRWCSRSRGRPELPGGERCCPQLRREAAVLMQLPREADAPAACSRSPLSPSGSSSSSTGRWPTRSGTTSSTRARPTASARRAARCARASRTAAG